MTGTQFQPPAGAAPGVEPTNRLGLWLGLSGIAGAALLLFYFMAGYFLFPYPSSNASASVITSSAAQYPDYYLLAAWLQVTGTFLIVTMFLGLVYITRSWTRFAGWLVFLSCAALLTLSLLEGAFFLGTVQGNATGQPGTVVTAFEMTDVFILAFFLVPSPLIGLGILLRRTSVVPRLLADWALAEGSIFAVLGLVGLFYNAATLKVILLVLMVAWVVCVSVALIVRMTGKRESPAPVGSTAL
jgi:hypothetical protein